MKFNVFFDRYTIIHNTFKMCYLHTNLSDRNNNKKSKKQQKQVVKHIFELVAIEF
jgi:hypothetical protein